MTTVPLMNLLMAAPGEAVELVQIRGGHQLRRRLADLGLCEGTRLDVLQCNPTNPLIVGVRDTRLALGRGVAGRIMVQKISPAD